MPSRKTTSLGLVPLFQGISDAGLEKLEHVGSWRNVRKGEQIINHLDTDDCVFALVSGLARVTIYSSSGRGVAFRTLRKGDVFGELAALDGQPRSANVEAVDECLIMRITACDFRALLESEPAVAVNLRDLLVANVRDLTARIFEFSTLAVQNRVQAELLRLARKANDENSTASIDPAPRHIDIASSVSTHREAVSRELSRLTKLGIIARHGRELRINDLDRLTCMVQEAKDV